MALANSSEAQDIYSKWKFATGSIDKIAPSVPTITYKGGSGACGWKNNYNIILSSTDEGSGIRNYEIDSNEDGNVDATTGSNFIPSNGWNSHNTRFRAVDNSGNRSGWTASQHIHMDTTAPVAPKITTSNDTTNTNECSFKIQITTSGTDDRSGVNKYQYSLNGGTTYSDWNDNTISFSSVTNYNVCLRTVDNAGNVSGASNIVLRNPGRVYIKQLYDNILVRYPSDAEIDEQYTKLFKSSGGAIVVHTVGASVEIKNKIDTIGVTEYIKRLYRGIFGREADVGGLQNNVNAYNLYGANFIVNNLANSTEAQNIYGKWGFGKGTI